MTLASPPDHYSPGQKWLHWLIAALILMQIPVGLVMAGRDPSPVVNFLYEWHKSIGLVILTLALIRVAVRARRGAPALVPGLPAWQRTAARASHYTLYTLIVLVPIIGWTATSACCKPVKLFWTIPLSLPVGGGMDAAKVIFRFHYAFAAMLAALVLIHAGAALHHHFVRRDATLRRMLPGGDAGAPTAG
jgi:cytochrome b561